jgi:hypothetical protein
MLSFREPTGSINAREEIVITVFIISLFWHPIVLAMNMALY